MSILSCLSIFLFISYTSTVSVCTNLYRSVLLSGISVYTNAILTWSSLISHPYLSYLGVFNNFSFTSTLIGLFFIDSFENHLNIQTRKISIKELFFIYFEYVDYLLNSIILSDQKHRISAQGGKYWSNKIKITTFSIHLSMSKTIQLIEKMRLIIIGNVNELVNHISKRVKFSFSLSKHLISSVNSRCRSRVL